jgi:GT2 family glycosyltransferase
LQAECPDAVILQGDGNLWWGGALQLAYDYISKGYGSSFHPNDIILIINDDVTIAEDFLDKGIQALEREPPYCMVLAQAIGKASRKRLDTGVFVDWKKFRFHLADGRRPINCLATRGLFMNCRTWLRSGGFVPRILPHYWSDYEFTMRAHKQGCLLRCPTGLELEVNESSTGIYELDQTQGFIRFVRTYFSKRCIINPYYMSVFAALRSPWPYKIPCLLRIWFVAIRKLAMAAFFQLSNRPQQRA